MPSTTELYLENKRKATENSALEGGPLDQTVVQAPEEPQEQSENPAELYAVRKREQDAIDANTIAQMALGVGDPTANAEYERIAEEYQTHINPDVKAPATFVEKNKDRMLNELLAKKHVTTISDSPMLRRWLQNADNTRVAADDMSALANVEAGIRAAGRAASRGFHIIGQSANQAAAEYALASADEQGKTFLQRYNEARRPFSPEETANLYKPDGTPDLQAFSRLRDRDPIGALFQAYTRTAIAQLGGLDGNKETLERSALNFQQQALKHFQGSEKATQSEGAAYAYKVLSNEGKPMSPAEAINATIKLIKERPGAVLALIVETGIQSAVTIVPAIAVTATTRNPKAGAAAMGMTSYGIERFTEPLAFFKSKGYDFSEPGAIERMLADRETMREAAQRGHTGGLIIGALDYVSMGLASKVIAKNPAIDLALQGLLQGTLGAAGEGLAQKATDGEVNFGELVIEFAAEFATAPVDVIGIGGRRLGDLQARARKAEEDKDILKDIGNAASASKVRERSAARFQDFIKSTVEGTAAENLYIPPEAFSQYMQDNAVTPEELAEALPGVDVEQIKRAETTGEHIVLPTATYATQAVGTPMDEFIYQNSKLSPDDMTLNEARVFRENEASIADTLVAEDTQRSEKASADEGALNDMYARTVEGLVRAGRPRAIAQAEALVGPAFYKALASKLNISVEEAVAQFATSKIRGPENAQVPAGGRAEDVFKQDGTRDVNTPEFKNWFKGSKAVDDEGKPRSFFHATPEGGFDKFHQDQFFSPSKAYASKYLSGFWNGEGSKPELFEVYLKTENPFDTRIPEHAEILKKEFSGKYGEGNLTEKGLPDWIEGRDIAEFLREKFPDKKFDAVIVDEGKDAAGQRPEAYIVFDPTQIKSINNRGTFDPNDPRILYSLKDGNINTESKAFIIWFGDSKVVDDEGNPLVVYHGTIGDIDWSDRTSPKVRRIEQFERRSGQRGIGFMGATREVDSPSFFFTPDATTAQAFARSKKDRTSNTETVLESVYLSIKNPFDITKKTPGVKKALKEAGFSKAEIDSEGSTTLWRFLDEDKFVNYLKEQGYDGAITNEKDAAKIAGAENAKSVISYAAFSPEQIKSTNNRGTFDPNDPRILYQFAGVYAETADQASLHEAQTMLNAGHDRDHVWRETGWFIGHDDLWRFEIDDRQATLKAKPPANQEGPLRLGQLINHDNLFRAYPELTDVEVKLQYGHTSSYDPMNNVFTMGIPMHLANENAELVRFKSVLLHEIQHYIQTREGFAAGSNEMLSAAVNRATVFEIDQQLKALQPGSNLAPMLQELRGELVASDKALSNALGGLAYTPEQWQAYLNAMGEVESRNVQFRAEFTKGERLALPPWATEEVEGGKQIDPHAPVTVKRANSELIRHAVRAAYTAVVNGGDPAQPLVTAVNKHTGAVEPFEYYLNLPLGNGSQRSHVRMDLEGISAIVEQLGTELFRQTIINDMSELARHAKLTQQYAAGEISLEEVAAHGQITKISEVQYEQGISYRRALVKVIDGTRDIGGPGVEGIPDLQIQRPPAADYVEPYEGPAYDADRMRANLINLKDKIRKLYADEFPKAHYEDWEEHGWHTLLHPDEHGIDSRIVARVRELFPDEVAQFAYDMAHRDYEQIKKLRSLKQQGPTKTYSQMKGFTSATAFAIEHIKLQKATGAQWYNTIKKAPGARQNELDWLGIEEFLLQEGRKSFTREEVMEFVAANQIDVMETKFRSSSGYNSVEYATAAQEQRADRVRDEWEADNEEDYTDEDGVVDTDALQDDSIEVYYAALEGIMESDAREVAERDGEGGETQFDTYVSVDGMDYEELAFSFGPNVSRRLTGEFDGAHFGPKNTFAHARVNVLGLPDSEEFGTLMLVQELQSDIESAAAERGYTQGVSEEERAAAKAALDDAVKALRDARREISELYMSVDARAGELYVAHEKFSRAVPPILRNTWPLSVFVRDVGRGDQAVRDRVAEAGGAALIEMFDAHPLKEEMIAATAAVETADLRRSEAAALVRQHEVASGIPHHPFEGTRWLDFAIKKVLHKAVADGHAQIAFNTGLDIAEASAGTVHTLRVGKVRRDGSIEPLTHRWTYDKTDKELFIATYIGDGSTGASQATKGLSPLSFKLAAPEVYAAMQKTIKAAADDALVDGEFTLDKNITVTSGGFVFEYDEYIPRFLEKYVKKWGGKVEYRNITGRHGPNPVVKITQAMRESINAGQFYQRERGRYTTFGDGSSLIELMKDANLSTFLHESAHHFLTTLQSAAMRTDGPNEIKDMIDTTRKWWRDNAARVATDSGHGVTAADVEKFIDEGSTGNAVKDRAVDTGMQEQWAKSFEVYLMEGKAPTAELRGVFEQFRAWLLEIYRKTKERLNVNVSDDIRQVFDMMLTADDAIQQAEEQYNGDMLALSAAEMGVTADEYKHLAALHKEAKEQMAANAIERAMRPIRKMRAAETKARRDEIRTTTAERVNAEPVHRALEWLGNKRWIGKTDAPPLPTGLRLDKDELVERYGKEVLQQLPRGSYRVYTTDGTNVDEAAGWFGFSSGDALIKALLTAEPRKAKIERETDEALAAEMAADADAEGSIEEGMTYAYHAADKRGDFIAAELKALHRVLGRERERTNPEEQPDGSVVNKRMLTATYARQVARQTLAGTKTRDAVAINRYTAAERREANAAQLAFKAGDNERAAGHKYKQLFSYMMASEAAKISEEVAKLERLAKRLGKKNTRKKLANTYLDALDEVLDQYDFRQQNSKREGSRERMLAYVEMMKAQGRENEIAIPLDVLENAKAEPYMSLTVEHLRGVYATLKNIESTARRAQKLIDAKRQREMTEVVNDILDAFGENIEPNPPGLVDTPKEQRGRSVKEYANWVLTAETLLRKIDGFKGMGAAYRHVKMGIDEATARLQVRRAQAATDLEALYDVYTVKERNKMAVREAHAMLGGRSVSKWDLIAVVLNMGNADNMQRITDTKVKDFFTPSQLEYIVGRMSKRDMDFVQSVWDYIDGYYAEIAAREKRVTGVTPVKVDAVALETAHGTYKGGYYPIKYDARKDARVNEETHDELMDNMRAGRFGKAQTRNGHTKERARSSGRPVKFDIAVLHGHINTVLHDLEMSEEVTNAWRVLQDVRVKGAFYDAGRQADHQALELWLQDVATGQLHAGDIASRFARAAKSGFTVSKLAYNMSTVLVQVTGLAQSMVAIGKKNFAKGMLAYAKDFWSVGESVTARSAFMAERRTTFNKDLYDMVGDVKVGPKAGAYKRFIHNYAMKHAFTLMQKTQFYAVDLPTWLGAYTQGVEDLGLSDAEAGHHADRAVARAQASGLFADRSAIERGTLSSNMRQNDVVRVFTTLGSYMFAKANVAYERTGRTNFKSPIEVLDYTVDMALLFTVEAVLYGAIKGTLPEIFGDDGDDDENWTEFLATETAMSVMGALPIVRDAASVVKGFDGGGAYGSIIETLTSPMTQALQGEVDKAAVKSTIDAVGMVFHLPSTTVNRIIDAESRRRDGEDVSPIEYLMGKR